MLETHRHHIGAVLVKELEVVEGVGEGRGVMGEDEVEAGVLRGAGGRWFDDTQVEGPAFVPSSSQVQGLDWPGESLIWGLRPQLDPRGGHTAQGWPMRAFQLPGQGD